MFWGYSLAYSRTGNAFIGNLANFGLKNVMAAPSPGSALVPEIVFCLYQMLFCACTVQLVIGGSFERGRILPSLVFSFCWATIVYCVSHVLVHILQFVWASVVRTALKNVSKA
jgi:Amt family ammonium transporter